MPPVKRLWFPVLIVLWVMVFLYWMVDVSDVSVEELHSLKVVIEAFGLAFWHVLTVPSISKLALLVPCGVVAVIVLIWRSQIRFLESMLRTKQRQLEMYAKESRATLAEVLIKHASAFAPEVLQRARYPGEAHLPSDKSVMPGAVAIRLCNGAVSLNVVLRRPKGDKHSVMLVASVTFKEALLDVMRTVPSDPSMEPENLIISTVNSGANPLVLSPNKLRRPVKKNKKTEPEDLLNVEEASLPPTMMLVEAIVERGDVHVSTALRQLCIASKLPTHEEVQENSKHLHNMIDRLSDQVRDLTHRNSELSRGEPDHTA